MVNAPTCDPHVTSRVLPFLGNHPYIYSVPSGTMAINAPVISGSDPGAVPGGSTNIPSFGGLWGRNRIDGRLKGLALSRLEATVIGAPKLVANDNEAPMALAA